MADEWFKLWHEMRHDEKLEDIAESMGIPTALAIGYWTCLLCLAHELDEEWHLRLTDGAPLRIERIAKGIHADTGIARAFLAECERLHMVVTLNGSPMIANGDLRNRKKSDYPEATRERQRVSRAKKRDMSRDREEEKRVKPCVTDTCGKPPKQPYKARDLKRLKPTIPGVTP